MNRMLIALLLATLAATAQEADVAAGAAALAKKDFTAAEAAYSKALETNPKHGGALLGRAYARLSQGKAKEALADLDKLIEIDDTVSGAYRLRADVKRRLRDDKGSLADFDKAIEREPDNANLYLNRGFAHGGVGDYEAALKDFVRTCETAPSYWGGWLHSAQTLRRLGRHKESLDNFEAAIFSGYTSPDVYTSRARSLIELGKREEAALDIKRATEAAPDSAEMLSVRGRYYFDLGENDKAVADLAKSVAKAEVNPNTEYTRLYLCLARMRAGDAATGKKELAEHLDARKVKDDWFVKVAGFLAGRLPEADFLAATKSDKPVVEREQKCEAYWYAGAARLAAGDKEKAKEYFEAAKAANVRNFIEYESALCALK